MIAEMVLIQVMTEVNEQSTLLPQQGKIIGNRDSSTRKQDMMVRAQT